MNSYEEDILGVLPTNGGFPPQKAEPPSFSGPLDYPPLPSIKVEDLSSPIDDDIFLRPPEPLGYYDEFQSHRLHNHHNVPAASHHFLGVKAHLGHTYLDLDSRCIALWHWSDAFFKALTCSGCTCLVKLHPTYNTTPGFNFKFKSWSLA